MVVTWDQLTFLTASQQALAAKFEKIGKDLAAYQNGKGPPPDTSTVTQSQAKGADQILRELMDLVGPAQNGIKYVNKVNEEAALKAYQDANPPPVG
jgi:hypothetical protein